jgi:hypothetical protein
MASAVFGGQQAGMGSSFADVYSAFAPLAVLHRTYADFLFYGTDVVIPDNLSSACDETGYLVALLHVDLLTQTGSQVVDTMPRLTRLRADLAVFCDMHSGTLDEISMMNPPDLDKLKGASEVGLFSDIYGLQQGLQFVFEAYLDGLTDEQETWEFAVAFSLKTLLGQTKLEKVEASLRDILYGSEEAVLPPAFVPQDIAAAIVELIQYVDIPLEAPMVDEICTLAQLIYDYVVGES